MTVARISSNSANSTQLVKAQWGFRNQTNLFRILINLNFLAEILVISVK